MRRIERIFNINVHEQIIFPYTQKIQYKIFCSQKVEDMKQTGSDIRYEIIFILRIFSSNLFDHASILDAEFVYRCASILKLSISIISNNQILTILKIPAKMIFRGFATTRQGKFLSKRSSI